MNLVDEMYRLDRLHQLIHFQNTGSINELAEKMQVSRRTALRLIGILKNEIGCPIYFNKYKNSYCYEYPIKLTIIKFENENTDNE